MLKLLLGRSGTGKTTELLTRILQKNGRRKLLLVPEQQSHELERKLCHHGGNGVSSFAEVLSFTRLASKVSAVAGGLADVTLDAGGRLLLMYRSLCLLSGSLSVFLKNSGKPAFLKGLLATMDELKCYCISPEDLEAIAAVQEDGGKFRDLSLIFSAYDALTARQSADPSDALTRLAERLDLCRFAEGAEVYLDGFTDFTPQEGLVLSALLRQAHSVTAALTCDPQPTLDPRAEELFFTARKTAAYLLNLAKKESVPTEVERLTGRKRPCHPALCHAEQFLFDAARPVYAESAPIVTCLLETPQSECEWIASEILRIVREEGFRFREIAVAGRKLDAYRPILETVFRRFGIPVFLSGQSSILQKPILTLVTSALNALSYSYRYEDMFRYLKTGLAGLSPSECDRLENYVLTWNIHGSAWERDFSMHPRGFGEPFLEGDLQTLSMLNDLRKRVVAPLALLKHGSDGTSYALALYRFMEEIGLRESFSARAARLHETGDLSRAEEYTQLWNILCRALDQCAAILSDTALSLEEFSKLFQLLLSQYEVSVIPVSLDRVIVSELPRLNGRECRLLFILGADDDALPERPHSAGLFSDEDRELLSLHGFSAAPRGFEKLLREMTIVYEACSLPSQGLVVSCAKSGTRGEEKRPSFLLETLRALFPGGTHRSEHGFLSSLAAPVSALALSGLCPEAYSALSALPRYRDILGKTEPSKLHMRAPLTASGVQHCYGAVLSLSASRIDEFYGCQFSYFMKYGLRARAREEFGFHAPEYGTFVHFILEFVLRTAEKDGGCAQLGQNRLEEILRAAIASYTEKYIGDLKAQPKRFQFLFSRLERTISRIVQNTAEELSLSQFRPLAFELGFGKNKALPAIERTIDGVTLSITGSIDRLDGYRHGGSLYIRVIDYKTGSKTFDFTEVRNGMGLQALLYLFSLKKYGGTFFGADPIPAGALYLPARDILLRTEYPLSDDALSQKADAARRRRGLISDDTEVIAAMERFGEAGARFLPLKISARTGELTGDCLAGTAQWEALENHVNRVVDSMASSLARGEIQANPYARTPEDTACRYCKYARACHFEDGMFGDKLRRLSPMGASEFWRELMEGKNP